jgi:hypothetical protein
MLKMLQEVSRKEFLEQYGKERVIVEVSEEELLNFFLEEVSR